MKITKFISETFTNSKGLIFNVEEVNISLPYELINKILSYIEGNHNKIIKHAIDNFYDKKRERFDFYDLRCGYFSIKLNIPLFDASRNQIVIDKYFKYTALHKERWRVNRDIKNLFTVKNTPQSKYYICKYTKLHIQQLKFWKLI